MRARSLLPCFTAALLALLAAPAAGSAVRPGEVLVEMDDGSGGCRVRGEFVVAVTDSIAWATLTDYEGIPRFVRSLRSSRVEQRGAGTLRLRQVAVGGVFVFRRTMQVLLEVHEEPRRRITFRDVARTDFREHVGEWRIAPDSNGVRVHYALTAEPRSATPKALCRGMLRRMARSLLEEVRDEMLRRASGPLGARTPAMATDAARAVTDDAAMDAQL